MIEKNFVAVLLLNWNNSDLTLQCVKSLNKSDYRAVSIYILDQNSRKEEYSKIKKIKGVKLFKVKENIGFAEGNNFLIREALKAKRNKYFFVLNNDTTLKEDCISSLVKTLEQKEIGAVQPKIHMGDNPSIIQEGGADRFKFLAFAKRSYFRCPEKDFPKEPFETDILCGAAMLIKREAIQKLDYVFKKDYFIYYEDTELSLRIKKAGYKLIINPHAELFHWESSTTQKISGFSLYYSQRNGIVIRKEQGSLLEKSIYYFLLIALKIPKNVIGFTFTGRNDLLKIYLQAIRDGLNLRTGNLYKDYKF